MFLFIFLGMVWWNCTQFSNCWTSGSGRADPDSVPLSLHTATHLLSRWKGSLRALGMQLQLLQAMEIFNETNAAFPGQEWSGPQSTRCYDAWRLQAISLQAWPVSGTKAHLSEGSSYQLDSLPVRQWAAKASIRHLPLSNLPPPPTHNTDQSACRCDEQVIWSIPPDRVLYKLSKLLLHHKLVKFTQSSRTCMNSVVSFQVASLNSGVITFFTFERFHSWKIKLHEKLHSAHYKHENY